MPLRQLPYDVFRQLASEGVSLRDCGHFGEGLAAARWTRNETAETSYILPNHHTLSLYVRGGEQIRRRQRGGELHSLGAGSLCLMPEGLTTDWLIAGPIELFHLYIPKLIFDRAIVAALDRDPARVTVSERTFFTDPMVEQVIRLAFLVKDWREPAESLALSCAGHLLIAHLIARYSDVDRHGLVAKGGLPPRLRQRVEDYVDANLSSQIYISDLADLAALSEFHFARMFKISTGEAPYSYVQCRRIERAKLLLAERHMPMAELALECGFASQSHFSACFRKHVGLTPRQYRAAAAV
jgi:AraC family transcriptional regulator